MGTWLKALALSTIAVFAPIKAVIGTAMVLTMADLILGVIAARKRGEKITSKGLGRTIVKVFVYEVAIMLGFLVQKFMIGDAIQITNLLGGLIGAVEMKSVLENLDSISGNTMFKTIIEKLGSQSTKDVSNEKQDPPSQS